MEKQKLRDTLVAGFTLFAMFLGAGNVIFPPYVGAMAGNGWLWATLGFILTAAGLPLLGTLTIVRLGGKPDKICERAWQKMGTVLNVIILIMIGPLFAIPRTAATTVEMSVLPFLPEGVNVKIVGMVVAALFFVITYLLSVSEGKVMDAIGSFLSPLLILFLFISIVLSVVNPMGVPAENTVEGSLFYYGFSSGYQTMDGIASLIMSGTIAIFISQRGYKEKEGRSILVYAALIAAALLGTVYAGYLWIGASGSEVLRTFGSRTEMLSHASFMLSGSWGQVLLGLIIFFACLTTSSGLTVTFAQYFRNLSNERFSYKQLCLFVVLVSFGISLVGVEGIIAISGPVLEVIYPLCIMLIILNMMSEKICSGGAFKGALIGTLIVCAILTVGKIPGLEEAGANILNSLPLGAAGFGYIPPAVIGFIIGTILDKKNTD